MKIRYSILLLFICFGGFAQTGIHFSHVTWAEAKAKAVSEKKIIFIDFYTQWCGPCLLMQKEIFPLNDVAEYFNTNFINLKIDAENGEGIELARKYKVKVYPTYSFVDPVTENLLHESTSRQDKETFIFTAKSATDPMKNSVYLNSQEKAGNNSPDFLINYANYMASCYKKEEVLNAITKLTALPGYSLENKQLWQLFVNNVSDRKNELFKEFIAHIDKYIKIHGKEEVDKKLYSSYNYCPDLNEFSLIPEFKGKDFLLRKNKADLLIRSKKYKEADVVINEMMSNPGEFQQEVCNFLYFTGRYAFLSKLSLPVNYKDFWTQKCLSYVQYAVYNLPDRENVQFIFSYASILEGLIKQMPEAVKYLPENFSAPLHGAKEFSIRPAELKQKPSK